MNINLKGLIVYLLLAALGAAFYDFVVKPSINGKGNTISDKLNALETRLAGLESKSLTV